MTFCIGFKGSTILAYTIMRLHNWVGLVPFFPVAILQQAWGLWTQACLRCQEPNWAIHRKGNPQAVT